MNYNNSELLDKLSAGKDFAQYLTFNGWNITNLQVLPGSDYAVFEQRNKKLQYNCNDKGSTFQFFIKVPNLIGWHEQNFIHGPDLEADVLRFAFLCHSMQWINQEDANLTCKNATGTSLFTLVKERFGMKFEARQIANEMEIAA